MDYSDLQGYVGVDIGGQSIKVGTYQNEELKVIDIPLPPTYDESKKVIVKAAYELAGGTPQGVGIGSPGPLDWRTGFVKFTPNIPWARNIEYTNMADDLGCQVWVDNDANVAGLAEASMGAGKGLKYVTGFTLGTGIGFFFIMDGQIYHGRYDVEGGHQIINPAGPLCGCKGHGHLESYISATAIMRDKHMKPSEINDPEFWDGYARILAQAIMTTNSILCPDIVILTGGIIKRGDMLMQPLMKHVKTMEDILPAPMIEFAHLAHRAGVVGAIVLGKYGHH